MNAIFAIVSMLASLASESAASASPDLSPFAANLGKRGELYRVSVGISNISIYDNALLALWRTRQGDRAGAARLLASLASFQAPDGSIAFSLSLPIGETENPRPYVRSGALAWVGYAESFYLDSSAAGPDRDKIAASAHQIAKYLIAHQNQDPSDLRHGLVTGGFGTLSYTLADNGQVREHFDPKPLEWVSTEHNIDIYFFLSHFARTIGNESYLKAADAVKSGLLRLWNPSTEQFRAGASKSAFDDTAALDCASWGSLFLESIGETAKARQALKTAIARYASRDPKTRTRGHKPYAEKPVYDSRVLAERFARELPRQNAQATWRQIDGVWPEGSAGVALAAARLGDTSGARSILREFAKLRRNGLLPDFTRSIPYEFSSAPSLAPTLWSALVEQEVEKGRGTAVIWRKP